MGDIANPFCFGSNRRVDHLTMDFQKNPNIPVLPCQTCQMTGAVGMKGCHTCKGYMVARAARDNVYFFGMALTRHHLALQRARRGLYVFEMIGALIFTGLAFLFFWWTTRPTLSMATAIDGLQYSSGHGFFSSYFWIEVDHPGKAFFFLGLLGICGLIYRYMRSHTAPAEVEMRPYRQDAVKEKEKVLGDWKQVKNFPHNSQINIVKAYTSGAKLSIERAYALADAQNSSQLQAEHVFVALLEHMDVKGIFIRLGIPVKLLSAKISEGFVAQKGNRAPLPNDDVIQILFHAYEQAYDAREPQVHVTELLLATVGQSSHIQGILYDIEVDNEKLYGVVEWVRIRNKLRRQYHATLRAGSHVSKHGIDKAMTAVATPFLNHFSTDLTLASMYGHHEPCVARDKEIDEIFRIVEAGRQSIVLVGEHGVGKRSIIEGIVERMIQDVVPKRMQDKRLVQISTSALLAGTTVSGAQERLLHMAQEIAKAKNIILCIHNISDLMGGSADAPGLDVAGTLSDLMRSGNILVLATSTVDGFNKHISRSRLASAMTRVNIKEMETDQAIQVLQAKAGYIEYTHNVFFSYNSLAAAVEYAKRFFHDQCLPQSAIEIISEVASYTKNTRGEHVLVSQDDVARVTGEKTGIPTTSLTENEADKLLRLEDEMHKRVVGQFEAVNSVANALRRARMQVRSLDRPMANFLFLGSTGVGKTELAKTIAEVYFGGEEQMIRVDMSEYQNTDSIYRLIGQPGKQGTGLLTEAVRQKPFSLVLLDELEKAHPRILDIFLQVFDDGRLTDSVGRVIDFTNTIIIATSNAGTAFIQSAIREHKNMEDIRKTLFSQELKQHFRPEFINRFDGVVVFKPLLLDDIKHIAGIMLARVEAELDEKGMKFRVTEEGLSTLAQHGYDPEYGARPMRRAIQDHVENAIAEILLRGEASRGETIVYDGEHGVYVE